MAKKVIKINSNPVPKTTIKTSSPTSDAVQSASAELEPRTSHMVLKKEVLRP
jgi:hypothetical protein